MTHAEDHIAAAHALLQHAAHLSTETSVHMRCIAAATHLDFACTTAPAGIQPESSTDPGVAIKRALQYLAGLPAPLFASPHILDAAEEARRALVTIEATKP